MNFKCDFLLVFNNNNGQNGVAFEIPPGTSIFERFRHPCSDFMEMIRRLTNCRIIIIINNITAVAAAECNGERVLKIGRKFIEVMSKNQMSCFF